MDKKVKKIAIAALVVLQFMLLYALLSDINTILSTSLIGSYVPFYANMALKNTLTLFVFICNIRSIVLLVKNKDDKKINKVVILACLYNVIFFLDQLFIYKYIELYVFYFASILFMIFVFAKLGVLKNEKLDVEVSKESKKYILVILAIMLVMTGEVFNYIKNKELYNTITKTEAKESLQNKDSIKINNLFKKEIITLSIKEIIFIASIAFIIMNRKSKNKASNNVCISLILLIISVLSLKNTVFYYICQITLVDYLANNYLEKRTNNQIK